jgi:hypothetical protein
VRTIASELKARQKCPDFSGKLNEHEIRHDSTLAIAAEVTSVVSMFEE